MAYQIIPGLTYYGREVYSLNQVAIAAPANEVGDDDIAPPANAVPVNYEDEDDDYEEEEDPWAGLDGIHGGKKKTRKYLSKNKNKSKKRRRISIRRKSRRV
jgi:hypothetical protein